MAVKRMVFLGAPGVGKGTQAQVIAERNGWIHLSTGDMLRENVRNETALGKEAKGYMDKGELVPDDLIVAMVGERLKKSDCDAGFILDGFPRTVVQAEKLDALLDQLAIKLDEVICIDVAEEEIVKRLSNRFVCEKSGKVVIPTTAGQCPEPGCDGQLVRRKDDEPETVRNRLAVYNKLTAPLISYYQGKGVLKTVDGLGAIDDVLGRITKAINV